MNHRIAVIFTLFLTLAFVPLTIGLVSAQEEAPPETPTCPTAPSPPSCSGSWTETQYSCSGQCKADILQRGRTCSWSRGNPVPITDEKGCITDYSDCSEAYSSGCGNWGAGAAIETCSAWQGCGSTEWSSAKNTCQCSGACLETPKNPRYYDNPTYSDEPAKDVGNNDVHLPVKLDWDDVKGWGETDGPQSYVALSQVLSHSEYIPGACLFQPNKTINWGAKACCGADGTNCGPESSWDFKTNLSPEPISPADPDWSGKDEAKNTSLPATIDWCDAKEANSYALRVYVMQGGEKACHPNLLTAREGGQFCEPLVLKKEWRTIEQEEKTLFSDFTDEDLNFFTKDTSYLWDIAACLSEDGFDCEFSQQWAFATGEKELAGTFLISPPNDPSGQVPVGLPLILNWRKDAGINSWLYKIDQTQELTTVPQSRSFDYPELSLNSPYKWQALSCWDYEGKKCQDNWSEIYSFITTGRPPKPQYPLTGTDDIIIPVNFDWEDVPGARSYIFKIQGSGLAVEKPVDESGFSLDYPDLKMSSNYSWQVKTCAKEAGQTCGAYSSPQGFRTFRISPPNAPESPSNGGMLFTDEHYISWKKVDGAKAYQYQIRYLEMDAEEQDQTCANAVGRELFGQPKNVSVKSDFVELLCLGQYQWQARSCLDLACQETGDWSGAWTFTLSEGGAAKGGLAPCGRKADTADTPWNEREPCQVKHLFLLVKIIIDFLLFRLVPFGLVLLTIYTAIIFYLSWREAAPLARVISLWKATGAGLVIMFFAWTAVNIFLKLIGYQVGIFGNWHQL